MRLAGLVQLFGLAQELHLHSLPLGDIGNQADRPLDRSRAVAQRIDGDMEPAIAEREVARLSRSPDASILAKSDCPPSAVSCQRSVVRLPMISVHECPRIDSIGPVGLNDFPDAVQEHHAIADGVEGGLPLGRRELRGVFGAAARKRARTVASSSIGSATLVR